MILSAQTIRNFAEQGYLVSPFCERDTHKGMSYGLSPAGYDIRLDLSRGPGKMRRLWVPNPRELSFPNCTYTHLYHPSDASFMLGSTMEHFNMPKNVLGVVHDKSSWARKGLAVQNTVIEPGWRGYLTLELTMHGPGEIILEHGLPIAQVVFHWLDASTEQPYDGKYQDQEAGPQEARSE